MRSGPSFVVHPAWAHSSGCKSRRELVTAKPDSNEGERVGEEAWRSCGPMNKNRIEGAADQGERAKNRKALVTKGRLRRSCGRAVKECVPFTWGDLALRPKARRHDDAEGRVSDARASGSAWGRAR
jgi:hypothetical protein